MLRHFVPVNPGLWNKFYENKPKETEKKKLTICIEFL